MTLKPSLRCIENEQNGLPLLVSGDFLGSLFLFLYLHMTFTGKHPCGLRIRYPLMFADKPYRIAVFATTKTFEYTFGSIYTHRCCLLVMERTAAEIILSSLMQRDISGDNVNYRRVV